MNKDEKQPNNDEILDNGFLEASEEDIGGLAQYIDAEENDKAVQDLMQYEQDKAQEIVQDIVVQAATETHPPDVPENQISMFDSEEFLQKEKEAALEGAGMEKTASIGDDAMSGVLRGASTGGYVQRPYTSPMLTLSDYKLPKTTNEFFKWCKYYYTFDPLIAGAINACATFPVTEIYLEDMVANEGDGRVSEEGVRGSDEESDTLRLYKRVLFKNLDITNFCILLGIDYQLYGNCFAFGEMKLGDDGKPEWCHLVRLDPNKIYIDFNPVTQEKRYRWIVPESLRRICKEKKPIEEYNKIPPIIKKAVEQNKSILLNSKRIYHFARPSDSAGDGGVWGTPIIAHVLKLITYRNILRQAQEAIAREHIVPMRIYYMQAQGAGSDYSITSNWSNVATNLASHIARSVRDPNYKVVSPYPLGLLNVGGEGKQLLLTPEIEQIQSEILAGMNVPREFIFGGVSYSGTSISLRILENQFITYRLKLLDFINDFLIRGMAEARGEWSSEKDDDTLITAKMVDMKMVDDVQQKQLIVELNAKGKVTDDYMWKSLGLDPDRIRTGLRKEALAQIDDNLEIQKKQIEMEAQLQKYREEIAMRYGLNQQEGDPNQGADPNADPNQQAQMQPQQEQMQPRQQGVDPNAEPPQQEQPQGEQADPEGAEEGADEENGQLYATAKQILRLPESQRETVLSSLPKAMQQQILEIMAALESDEKREEATKVDMRPYPQQRPPRRAGY